MQYYGHSGPVWKVKYDVPRKKLFSGGYDGTLKTWNLESGKCEHSLRVENENSFVRAIDVFGNAGEFVISGQSDGTLRLWDVKNQALVGQKKEDGLANVHAVLALNNSILSSHANCGRPRPQCATCRAPAAESSLTSSVPSW